MLPINARQHDHQAHHEKRAYVSRRPAYWPRTTCLELLLCTCIPTCCCLLVWLALSPISGYVPLAGQHTDFGVAANTVFELLPISSSAFVAVHTQGQIRVHDIQPFCSRGELQTPYTHIMTGAFCPVTGKLAIGTAHGTLEVRDLNQPEIVLASRNQTPMSARECMFSEDGTRLLVANEVGEINLLDSDTLHDCGSFSLPGMAEPIRSFCLSKDNGVLIAGTITGNLHLWNVATRRYERGMRVVPETVSQGGSRAHQTIIELCEFLPNQQTVLVVTRHCGLSVWDLKTGTCLRSWSGREHPLRAAKLVCKGRYCITGDEYGTVRIWDIESGTCLKTIQSGTDSIRSLACLPNGTIVTGNWHGDVQVHQEPDLLVTTGSRQ